MLLYTTTKVGLFFQLKTQTLLSLRSDVVYMIACSRDASTSYIGASSQRSSVKIKEHLSNSASNKSVVKEHIQNSSSCSQEQRQDLNLFTLIRKCNTAHEIKIQKALLIKKQNPNLNKHIYAKGVSFLLNIY